MISEILRVVEMVSNEKGVSEEIIFDAIEAALASATRKRSPLDIDARVSINHGTGDYETFRVWRVLPEEQEEVEFPDRELLLEEARRRQPEAEPGECVEESIESVEFGRIAAQAARQVIVQKVREAERARVIAAYQGRVGSMVSGVIKKVDRSGAVLDLGNNAEGLVPRSKLIPRENVRIGDRLRAHLLEVRELQIHGPQLLLSRTAPELLTALFALEVPEISEGLVEIVVSAREPGSRARIAVRARDARVDPIGACVGMRGSRVQAVSNDLAGERVDIVAWHENPAQYVLNAMGMAEIVSVLLDEDRRSMDLVVEEEQLSQAIGRGGQNVKLASELTGWILNVISLEQARTQQEEGAGKLQALFMERLGLEEPVASILVQEGFSSIEEIAYVPEQELLAVEEFEEEMVGELRRRAKDLLLTEAIIEELKLRRSPPAADLLELEGMDRDLAYQLAGRGITTREELADLDIDELLELLDLDPERARQLIMKAREHWFEGEGEVAAQPVEEPEHA